jgi:hypothetical protein
VPHPLPRVHRERIAAQQVRHHRIEPPHGPEGGLERRSQPHASADTVDAALASIGDRALEAVDAGGELVEERRPQTVRHEHGG